MRLASCAVLLATLAGGCCDESVVARAYVGHLSPEECLQRISENEPPLTLLCPGSEVTVCWAARGKTPPATQIKISPDPDGQSGTYSDHGAIYLKPNDDTQVTLTASACAVTTKQIQVVTGEEPATFDARWDSQCQTIGYELNPAFVDPGIKAKSVTAKWNPVVIDETKGEALACATPPFLRGVQAQTQHHFSIPKPFQTEGITAQPAAGDWNYVVEACTEYPGWRCYPDTVLPFAMTLTCAEN